MRDVYAQKFNLLHTRWNSPLMARAKACCLRELELRQLPQPSAGHPEIVIPNIPSRGSVTVNHSNRFKLYWLLEESMSVLKVSILYVQYFTTVIKISLFNI